MRTYFLSLILVSLFGGICGELLPENGGLRPHLKLVTGLCLVAVLVLPAKDLLREMGDFFVDLGAGEYLAEHQSEADFSHIFADSLSRSGAEAAGELLSERLTEVFALKKDTCRAEIYFSDDGEPSRVLVCLSGASVLQSPYEIEAYVNELLSCPCDVAVGR